MAHRICKLCEKEFKTGVVLFSKKKIRIGTNRHFCLKCVPPNSPNPNQFTGKDPPQRTCSICGEHFNAWHSGKYLDSRKKYCFECVPCKSSYFKKIKYEGKTLQCYKCKKKYKYKRRGFHNSIKFCGSCVKKRHEKQLKLKAVEYKGGKCNKCGFNRWVEALTFHHKDPAKKKFGISRGVRDMSWERLKKELDKCILLCANCHAGVHAGHIEIQ